MKIFSSIALVIIGLGLISLSGAEKPARPNVLFISVDDLNDWIEPLGGHSQAKTPHFTRLAAQSVTFARNYCPSPGCNPSRSATMTGVHPSTSGMYSNYQDWRKAIPKAATLGSYFRKHGYYSAGAGKIFHYTQIDPNGWESYFPSLEKPMLEGFYPNPGGTVNMPKFPGMYGEFDWSPIPLADGETADGKTVSWVIDQLGRKHERPFFLACGIYRPHVPWYVPQKYFDLHPLDSIRLPKVLENDRGDLGGRALELADRAGGYHQHVIAAGQWKKAVQGYLASVSFADAMLGRLLDALATSPHAKNTVVVVWSDHGWQLGEKRHWRKFALWNNVARCPLFIRDASGTSAGRRCERVTSLIDIYPTLLDLCGLPPREELDGRSLVPLIENPDAPWDYPALTSYDITEFAVTTERWRYIRYLDDSEELYDLQNDPEEWHNLAGRAKHAAIQSTLAAMIPEKPAPLLEETLIKLQPHHVRPILSKEDYRKRRAK